MKSYIQGDKVPLTELSQHGVYFARGGAIELLTLQSVARVTTNNWQEEDGLEIDPKTIATNCPYIHLRFIVLGRTRDELGERLEWLRQLIGSHYLVISPALMGGDGAYHVDHLSFESYRHLGKPLYLKGNKGAEVTVRCRLKQAQLRTIYKYDIPNLPLTRILLGDTDLSAFGIQVQSAYNSLLLPANFKEGTRKEEPREVAIHCFSQAPTYAHLEHHLALLWDDVKNKQLHLTYGTGRVRCYYSSMTDVKELPLQQGKAMTFTLNFMTT